VWLTTNHLPKVRGRDWGIWRRLKAIPFNVVFKEGEFAEHKLDNTLPAALRDELPGILAWCVEGCKDWHLHGLQEPDIIHAATQQYRVAEDTVRFFVSERCIADAGMKAQAQPLLTAYQGHTGDKSMTMQKFGKALRELGYQPKVTGGKTYYHGIGLLANEEVAPAL